MVCVSVCVCVCVFHGCLMVDVCERETAYLFPDHSVPVKVEMRPWGACTGGASYLYYPALPWYHHKTGVDRKGR